jgi:NAD(P)-dependent dehydrogenase (short-subunit alcohol dehydrogenase family)
MDFSPADVSCEDELEALVAGAVEKHGRLDCAINTPARRSSARSPRDRHVPVLR